MKAPVFHLTLYFSDTSESCQMCTAVTVSPDAFIHGKAALKVSSGGNEGWLMIYDYANVFTAAVVCLMKCVLCSNKVSM